MSDIFDNYNYIPASYIPQNRKSSNKPLPTPQAPYEEYNVNGDFIGYAWNYNDTVVLEFNTVGEVVYDDNYFEDAETYLTNKTFIFTLYDFRYKIVYQNEFSSSDSAKIIVSSGSLVKGTYKGSLVLKDADDNMYTLIDADDYIFRVK